MEVELHLTFLACPRDSFFTRLKSDVSPARQSDCNGKRSLKMIAYYVHVLKSYCRFSRYCGNLDNKKNAQLQTALIGKKYSKFFSDTSSLTDNICVYVCLCLCCKLANLFHPVLFCNTIDRSRISYVRQAIYRFGVPATAKVTAVLLKKNECVFTACLGKKAAEYVKQNANETCTFSPAVITTKQ